MYVRHLLFIQELKFRKPSHFNLYYILHEFYKQETAIIQCRHLYHLCRENQFCSIATVFFAMKQNN